MSRPKKRTVAELEAERDRMNRRIAAARKAERQEQDADIVKAAEEWAAVVRPGTEHADIAKMLRDNAAYITRRRAEKQEQAAQQTKRPQWNNGN